MNSTTLIIPAGGTELIVILAVAVLLFGATKIPKVANAFGRSLGEFRKGREESWKELETKEGEKR